MLRSGCTVFKLVYSMSGGASAGGRCDALQG
jgi:hypothetical protein